MSPGPLPSTPPGLRPHVAGAAGTRSVSSWLTRPAIVVAGCVVLAVASLAWHSTPGFDPWAWAVWGRELAELELDTGSGLSWKPLPVLFTAAFSLFGGAAEDLWLVVARAGGLLAVAATFGLASRAAGRAAGVVAVGGLLLAPGPDARFVRLAVQGSIEPLLVALCLWAVQRHLEARHGQAFALGVAAALARPEVWPLLAVYAWWLSRHRPELRAGLVVGLGIVPALWFGGDWLGSGDPLAGASRARVVGAAEGRIALVASRLARLVVVPVWVGAAAAAVSAWRGGDRTLLVLASAAALWMAEVGAMTLLLGYDPRGRFLLPAAALLCVLAGVGAVRALRGLADRRVRIAAATGLVAAAGPLVAGRVPPAVSQVELTHERALLDEQLDLAIDGTGGVAAVTSCGGVAIDMDGPALVMWPGLAWKLDLPIGEVHPDLLRPDGIVFALADEERDRRLSDTGGRVRRLGGSRAWTVFQIGCPDWEPDAPTPDPAQRG